MGKRTHGPHLLHAIETNDHAKVHDILAAQVRNKKKIQELCVSEVKRLASESTDIPLMLSSSIPDPSIIKYLITKHGIDVNFIYSRGTGRKVKLSSPLLNAVRRGLLPTVDALLALNADSTFQDHKGRTPLHHAVKRADFKMVKVLLARGAQANITDKANNTPLHTATKYGHLEMAKVLLQYNADMYKKGNYGAIPIHVAAHEGHVPLLQLFVQHEVSINTKIPCYTDMREKSPLHVAAEEGQKESVFAMLDQFGGEVNLTDSEGETPLHCTVINEYNQYFMRSKDDYSDCAKVLIQFGSDVNLRNGRGEAPLHLAARNEYQKVVELLLIAGADPLVEDNDKNKPYDLVSDDDTVSKQALKRAMTDREKYVNQMVEARAKGLSGSITSMPGRMMGSMQSLASLQYGPGMMTRAGSMPGLFAAPGGLIYEDGYLQPFGGGRQRMESVGSELSDNPFDRARPAYSSMRSLRQPDPMVLPAFDRNARAGSLRSLHSIGSYHSQAGQPANYAYADPRYASIDNQSEAGSVFSENANVTGSDGGDGQKQVRRKTSSQLNRLLAHRLDISSDSSQYDEVPPPHRQRIITNPNLPPPNDISSSTAPPSTTYATSTPGRMGLQYPPPGMVYDPHSVQSHGAPVRLTQARVGIQQQISVESKSSPNSSMYSQSSPKSETSNMWDTSPNKSVVSAQDPNDVTLTRSSPVQNKTAPLASQAEEEEEVVYENMPDIASTLQPAQLPVTPVQPTRVPQAQNPLTTPLHVEVEPKSQSTFAPKPSPQIIIRSTPKQTLTIEDQNPVGNKEDWRELPEQIFNANKDYSAEDSDDTFFDDDSFDTMSDFNVLADKPKQSEPKRENGPQSPAKTNDPKFKTWIAEQAALVHERRIQSGLHQDKSDENSNVVKGRGTTGPSTPQKPITAPHPTTPQKPVTIQPPTTPQKPLIAQNPSTPQKPITAHKPLVTQKPLTPQKPSTPVKPKPAPKPKPRISVPTSGPASPVKVKSPSGSENEETLPSYWEHENTGTMKAKEAQSTNIVVQGSKLPSECEYMEMTASQDDLHDITSGQPQHPTSDVPPEPPDVNDIPRDSHFNIAKHQTSPTQKSNTSPTRQTIVVQASKKSPVSQPQQQPVSPGYTAAGIKEGFGAPMRASIADEYKFYKANAEVNTASPESIQRTVERRISQSEIIDESNNQSVQHEQHQYSPNAYQQSEQYHQQGQYQQQQQLQQQQQPQQPPAPYSHHPNAYQEPEQSRQHNQYGDQYMQRISRHSPQQQESPQHKPPQSPVSRYPISPPGSPDSVKYISVGRQESVSSAVSSAGSQVTVIRAPSEHSDSASVSEHSQAPSGVYEELPSPSRRVTIGDETVIPHKNNPSQNHNHRRIAFNNYGKPRINIIGGNSEGIYIHRIDPGSEADQRGVLEGDQLLWINGRSMKGKTQEEAIMILMNCTRQVEVVVRYRRECYERVMDNGGMGDSFFVKAFYSFTPIQPGEMSISDGDVFSVSDTLPSGKMGSWRALKINAKPDELQNGLIPNQARAEQIALAAKRKLDCSFEKEQRGGFLRRSMRKSKSVDHLNKSIDSATRTMPPITGGDVKVYEWVVQRPPTFIRPVILIGLFCDSVRDRLVADSPTRFEKAPPEVELPGANIENYTSMPINMNIIQDCISRERHCLMIVSPRSIGFLHTTQLFPIVIYLDPGSKMIIKSLRTKLAPGFDKRSSFMYEEALNFERTHSHLFTHKVTYTTDDSWFTLLKDTIGRIQNQPIWQPVPPGSSEAEGYESDPTDDARPLQDGTPQQQGPPMLKPLSSRDQPPRQIPNQLQQVLQRHASASENIDHNGHEVGFMRPPNTTLTYDGYFMVPPNGSVSTPATPTSPIRSQETVNISAYMINGARNSDAELSDSSQQPRSILKKRGSTSSVESFGRPRSGSNPDVANYPMPNGYVAPITRRPSSGSTSSGRGSMQYSQSDSRLSSGSSSSASRDGGVKRYGQNGIPPPHPPMLVKRSPNRVPAPRVANPQVRPKSLMYDATRWRETLHSLYSGIMHQGDLDLIVLDLERKSEAERQDCLKEMFQLWLANFRHSLPPLTIDGTANDSLHLAAGGDLNGFRSSWH